MLEIGSVTKRFGGQAALDGIFLPVVEATFLALQGPGESSGLRVLGGIATAAGMVCASTAQQQAADLVDFCIRINKGRCFSTRAMRLAPQEDIA